MIDATLQVINLEVVPAGDHIELHATLGLLVPTPNGVAPLPSGLVRIPLSKQAAMERGQDMIDVAETLPDPPKQSGLVIADSLAGVDQAVKMNEQFKGR